MLGTDLNSFRVSTHEQISVLHYFLYTLYIYIVSNSGFSDSYTYCRPLICKTLKTYSDYKCIVLPDSLNSAAFVAEFLEKIKYLVGSGNIHFNWPGYLLCTIVNQMGNGCCYVLKENQQTIFQSATTAEFRTTEFRRSFTK